LTTDFFEACLKDTGHLVEPPSSQYDTGGRLWLLHKQVVNLTFVVTARHSQNRRPAIITAISSRCHCDVRRGRRPCNSVANRPELQDPRSHRFVGHIEPTLSEQIFKVVIAERETHIEPNGVPDDRGRKLVAGKRDRHPPSYPANRDALALP